MEKFKTLKPRILRKDFETLSIKDSLHSCYYVIDMINQVKFHEETIENKKIVEKVFMNLPPKFDTLL